MSDAISPGDWVGGNSEARVIRVLRPRDGTLVGELAVTPAHDLPRRVARGRSVQEGWASLDVRDRTRRLRGLLNAVGAGAGKIADTIIAETGKPRTEALVEVTTVLDLLRYYLKKAPGFLARRRVPTGWLAWKSASLTREPMGVIGVISPWNYPFILSMSPVATALFGGNAAILKPSELTPYSGLLAEDLARTAGLPDGLVQVVVGAGDTGEALVRSGVDKIIFTGGSETGRKVLTAAAESLTPAVMELGGKDAAIVLEDADLERAARGVLWGGFQNAGQACIGVERVFVVEEAFEPFLHHLLEGIRRIRAGSDPGTDVGPMISEAQLRRVESHLEEAVERGGAILAGGHRADPASNVFHPTLVTEVHREASLMQEETFGPLLPIIPVKDEEEAVRRANEGHYGLSASVWTGDRARGEGIAGRLRVGAVTVNDVLVHYGIPGLPFGGVGESGFGRTHGLDGLGEVTRTKGVVADRLGLEREPWWYPYSRVTESALWAGVLFLWKGGVRGAFEAVVAFIRRKRG